MKIRNQGHDKWELIFSIALSVTTFLIISSLSTAYAADITENTSDVYRDQAKRMHDRLIGVPPTEEVLNGMANYIEANEPSTAAMYAMTPSSDPTVGNPRAKYFYNVTLKNWITPWTNEEQTVFAPLNDYTATVIGMIRDDIPFSQLLSKDIVYVGNVGNIQTGESKTIPAHSESNNDHYAALESNDIDLSNGQYLESRTQTQMGMAGGAAGIMTTRAAGQAFFSAGTNRAMFRFTSMNYLCRDLEDLKDVTRVPDRIRQDVSRSPGGDSSIFLNSCIGCHAGMDPLAQAYAYYEWNETTGVVEYTSGSVQPKYHINSTNFEYGYRTPNDAWTNYWRSGPNAGLGWGTAAKVNGILEASGITSAAIIVDTKTDPNDPTNIKVVSSGTGAASMGAELAATEAFAQCQVEKVYKQVCLQNPIFPHNGNISNLTTRFMSPVAEGGMNYSMKSLFAEVAALCMGN
jgi:hypothetical protein